MAELGVLIHHKRTAPELGDWIARAESEPLDEIQRANLHEIKRHWQDASLLPSDLVEALSLAGSKCEHAWRRQRKENDWAGFAPNLEEVVRLSREVATLRADALGVRPYDAMLALYEPGMTSARLGSDLRRSDELAARPHPDRERAAEERRHPHPTRPLPHRDAAGARPGGDGAARL